MSINQWSAFGSLCCVCFAISAMWQMSQNEIREWRAIMYGPHDPGGTGAGPRRGGSREHPA